MSENVFKLDKKKQSQLDLGGVLRSAHDDPAQALRTVNGITSVPSSYSNVALTYNAQGSVTRAIFYEGTQAQLTEITAAADIGGSLNNQYITIYSENNESQYHVWFNVNSSGTDPAPSGSIGVEVQLNTNDSVKIVATAMNFVLRHLHDFCVVQVEQKVRVENSRKGVANLTVDSGTGFALTTIETGSQRLLKVIDIPYDGITKYLYNNQDRRFEVESVRALDVSIDADSGDNIAISGHENPRIVVDDSSFLDIALSTAAYTEIFSYTATENLRLRKINLKADTFGAFRIKVDGVIRDYYQTSPIYRNGLFEFLEEEHLNNTQELTIEFLPDRLCITNYNFFMRIEGYVD